MKKLIITSLSALALAMAFTGCGESGSVSSGSDTVTGDNGSEYVDVSPVTGGTSTEITTPKTPFNLSEKLGTPPGLPE